MIKPRLLLLAALLGYALLGTLLQHYYPAHFLNHPTAYRTSK